MKKLRLAALVIAATWAAGPVYPDALPLPPGAVVGGVVENDGDGFILLRRSRSVVDGSVLVRLRGRRSQEVELPDVSARSLSALAGGRLLVESYKGPVIDDQWSVAHEIIKIRGADGRAQTLWEWNSRDPKAGPLIPVSVSADGRVWGAFDGKVLFLGGTGRPRASVAREEAPDLRDQPVGRGDTMGQFRVTFLDSRGPVVLIPRDRAAVVVHVSGAGSGQILPVALDSEKEFAFRWQWSERVLWALTRKDWKAYNFWNFGLDAAADEPFWRVPGSSEPHAERGIVRTVRRDGGGWRVEHLWRDPWTLAEERRVSDWLDGSGPARLPGSQEIFVSPNGRIALVVGQRVTDEGESQYVRRLDLTLLEIVDLAPDEEDKEAPVRDIPDW